jgi:hypothetical protein
MPDRASHRSGELVDAPCATCGRLMARGPMYVEVRWVEVRWVDGREQPVAGVGYCSNDCAAAEMIETFDLSACDLCACGHTRAAHAAPSTADTRCLEFVEGAGRFDDGRDGVGLCECLGFRLAVRA